MSELADQAVGLGGEADELERLLDLAVHLRLLGAADPGAQAVAGGDLGADPHVLEHGELGKDLGDLEGARHAERTRLCAASAVTSLPVEGDRAGGRAERSR